MKTILLSLSLAVAGVSPVHAQIYQPAVVNGSILGGIAGAIVGGHNQDRWGEGALIGAVAGALLGSTVQAPRPVVYQQPPVTVIQNAPTVPMAATVPDAPAVVLQPAPASVVYVQAYQPARVVYVEPALVVYVSAAPYFGYGGGVRYVYGRSGHGRW